MNPAARYRAQLLYDDGSELDAYLSIGGGFSRREIDAAHDMARAEGTVAKFNANLHRARLREDVPAQETKRGAA
jgi:hypothetical protein